MWAAQDRIVAMEEDVIADVSAGMAFENSKFMSLQFDFLCAASKKNFIGSFTAG